MKLGQLLQRNREKLGLTREDISNRIGISIEEVKDWEQNNYLPRTVSILTAMSEVYKLDSKEMIEVLSDAF